MLQPKKISAQSDDFRLYLEEKFRNLHEKLEDISVKQENTDLSLKELTHFMDTSKIQNSLKCFTCDNSGRIKGLEDKLQEISFFKAHWKTFAISGAVSIVGLFVGVTETKKVAENFLQQFISAQKTEIQKEIQPVKKMGLENRAKIYENKSEYYRDKTEEEIK